MSQHSIAASEPELTLSTGADQAALLRQFALEAHEPDASGPHLPRTEAARRIAMLREKFKLRDGSPHTLWAELAVEVPAIKTYMVNNCFVLADPATSEVVDEIVD
jgi:hypothetical protein